MDGQLASIDGSTQLRAGVVRPEIIVSLDRSSDQLTHPSPTSGEIGLGASVMIVRDPGFGIIGRVASLGTQPEVVASGALVVTVVVVEEGTGREWVVPQTNLKLLRGAAL